MTQVHQVGWKKIYFEYKYKCEAGHKEEGGTKRDEGGEEEKRHRFSAVELAAKAICSS